MGRWTVTFAEIAGDAHHEFDVDAPTERRAIHEATLLAAQLPGTRAMRLESVVAA